MHATNFNPLLNMRAFRSFSLSLYLSFFVLYIFAYVRYNSSLCYSAYEFNWIHSFVSHIWWNSIFFCTFTYFYFHFWCIYICCAFHWIFWSECIICLWKFIFGTEKTTSIFCSHLKFSQINNNVLSTFLYFNLDLLLLNCCWCYTPLMHVSWHHFHFTLCFVLQIVSDNI